MKTLEQLRREKSARDTPNAEETGYFDFKFKVKKPKTTAQLEGLMSEYCRLSGGFLTRVYSGGRERTTKEQITDVIGRKNSITDTKFLPSIVMKGHSDTIVFYRGFAMMVEVKLGKDYQKPDQKEFEKLMIELEIPYRIVKTLGEFEVLFSVFMKQCDLRLT